jgi:hypothetical protein
MGLKEAFNQKRKRAGARTKDLEKEKKHSVKVAIGLDYMHISSTQSITTHRLPHDMPHRF